MGLSNPSSVGMTRLDLHGNVVAVFRPTGVHAVNAAPTNREASHG